MLKEITEFHGKDIYETKAVLKRCAAYVLYLVQARQSGQFFMIKTLDQNEYKLEQWLRREGKVLASVYSPYIVQLCDIGQVDGHVFLVMELVHGRLLSDWQSDQNHIDEFTAIQFLRQMAQALKDSDFRGIVHQSIGPDSIFICPPFNGRDMLTLKLWDFGLASVRRSARVSEPGQVGVRLGFWAPEKVNYEPGNTPIDVRTDIYGAGAIIYWLLTRVAPYEAENPGRLVMKIADHTMQPAPLQELRPDLSRDFIRLIQDCLEKGLNKRIASPQALMNRLDVLAPTSDQLNFLYHQAMQAAKREQWQEVLEWAEEAKDKTGGAILFQELVRQAKQRLEQELVDSIHNSLYNARDLLERGELQKAELKIRRLEETVAQRPDLAEKLNLAQASEELYRNLQAKQGFKPALLVSFSTNGDTKGAQGHTYPLVKPTHKIGRPVDEHVDPLQDLDLIDMSAEPKGLTVSRTQAWLHFRNGDWWLKTDLQATNQTLINKHVVAGDLEHKLSDQDILTMGDVTLQFRLSNEG